MLLTATRLQQHATTASYLLFHLVVGCCFILYCYVFEVLVPNVHCKPFPCFSGQWGSILIWSSCHLPETLAIFVSYFAFGSYCFNMRSASEIVDEKQKFLEKNFRVQQQLGSKVCWLLTLIKSWLQHHVRPAWLLPICRHASDHLPPWRNNEGTSLSENGQVLRLSAAPSQA